MRQFPWAYVTPGRGYLKILRIARLCPEIRWQIHERERLRLMAGFKIGLWSPVLIPLILFNALAIVMEAATDWLLNRWQSPVAHELRQRRELLRQIHEVLPPNKIRDRLDGRDNLFF